MNCITILLLIKFGKSNSFPAKAPGFHIKFTLENAFYQKGPLNTFCTLFINKNKNRNGFLYMGVEYYV